MPPIKIFGWRSAAYAGSVLIPMAGAVVVAIALDIEFNVRPAFYSAVAQVIPILLLAHTVRLASLRTYLPKRAEPVIEHERRGEMLARRFAEVQEKVEAKTDLDEAEVAEWEALKTEVGDELDNLEARTSKEISSLLELLAGNLIVTLVAGGGGLVGALAALATASDAAVYLVLAVIGVGLTTIALIFELVVFSMGQN